MFEIRVKEGAEDYGVEINAALAKLPVTGGVVMLPTGVLNVATTITSPKNGCTIQGQGDASLNSLAPTVLSWIGGASPVITIDSTRDWALKDFNIDNRGAATIGVNAVSNFSNIFNLLVDHVSIVNPIKKFSSRAMSVTGPSRAVSTYVTFRKVFESLAAPVGLYVDHANVVRLDDSVFMNNTVKNIDVGPVNVVVAFHMTGGSAEFDSGAGENVDAIGIDLGIVYSSSIRAAYFENQKSRQFAIQVGAKVINAEIASCFFNSPLTVTEYAVSVINGYFPITIHDNMFDNYLKAGITSNAPTHLSTYSNSAAGNTPIVIAGGQRFAA